MAKNPLALLWAWVGPGDEDYERLGSVQDGVVHRLLVSSKTVVTPPAPPTGATAVTIDASVPLEVEGNPLIEETEYTIPDTKSFYLQFVAVGAAGDPTEKGAKVEIFYAVGATRHVLERYYLTGFTLAVAHDDVAESRDGTVMVGDGTTTKIIVKRQQMSKAGEIDTVVRGYVL